MAVAVALCVATPVWAQEAAEPAATPVANTVQGTSAPAAAPAALAEVTVTGMAMEAADMAAPVSVLDGAESVRHYNGGPAVSRLVKRFLNHRLAFQVQR